MRHISTGRYPATMDTMQDVPLKYEKSRSAATIAATAETAAGKATAAEVMTSLEGRAMTTDNGASMSEAGKEGQAFLDRTSDMSSSTPLSADNRK